MELTIDVIIFKIRNNYAFIKKIKEFFFQIIGSFQKKKKDLSNSPSISILHRR